MPSHKWGGGPPYPFFVGLPDGPDIRHSTDPANPFNYFAGRLVAGDEPAKESIELWLRGEHHVVPDSRPIDTTGAFVVEFSERGIDHDLVLAALDNQAIKGPIAPDYILTFAGHANFYGFPAEPTDAPLFPSSDTCDAIPLVGVVDTGFIDFGSSNGRPARPLVGDTLVDYPHPPPILDPDVGHGESVAWLISRFVKKEGEVGSANEAAIGAPAGPAEDRIVGKSVHKIWSAIPAMHGVVTDSELARAVMAMLGGGGDKPADIITITVGCTVDKDHPLLSTKLAIDKAVEGNVLVVAAAGNDATKNPVYPAAWPKVLGVGASSKNDAGVWVVADFSNYSEDQPGADDEGVNVYAPSEYVVPHVTGSYFVPHGLCDLDARTFMGRARVHGTSFAVPRVVGEIACRWDPYQGADGTPTERAMSTLRESALDGFIF